jgi:hypothetical protein
MADDAPTNVAALATLIVDGLCANAGAYTHASEEVRALARALIEHSELCARCKPNFLKFLDMLGHHDGQHMNR